MQHTPTTSTARVVRADGARTHTAAGNTVTVLVGTEDLASMSVVDYRVGAGFAAPPALHHHLDLDWLAVVLEGRLTFVLDDGEHELARGDAVVVPCGADFAWRNAVADQEARMLCVYSPSGFERFFDDVAAGIAEGRNVAEVVPPLWERYGVEAASGTVAR